jgi:hypothetical protein
MNRNSACRSEAGHDQYFKSRQHAIIGHRRRPVRPQARTERARSRQQSIRSESLSERERDKTSVALPAPELFPCTKVKFPFASKRLVGAAMQMKLHNGRNIAVIENAQCQCRPPPAARHTCHQRRIAVQTRR